MTKNSILAHLSGRITTHQELLATEGLTYILQHSESCRKVIAQLALRAGCRIREIVSFRSESSGDNRERPDIVGSDKHGVESLIIEGKFDAGLTDNQPNGYIGRLQKAETGLLLFVVPELRVNRLWHEVSERAKIENSIDEEGMVFDGAKFCQVNRNQILMMISWRELLDLMMHAAQTAAESSTADIHQMQSLCQTIEGAAFLPFSSEELTSIRLPKRNRDLCDLTDAIVDRLRQTGELSVDGLRATPVRHGYLRYVNIVGPDEVKIGAAIGLLYDAWERFEQSPIWITTTSDVNSLLQTIMEEVSVISGVKCEIDGGRYMLPLPVRANFEFDEIVDQCVQFVRSIGERLRALDTP